MEGAFRKLWEDRAPVHGPTKSAQNEGTVTPLKQTLGAVRKEKQLLDGQAMMVNPS